MLFLSDTHGKHRQIPLEWIENKESKIDTIIHAGDISNIGHLNQLEDFFDWYEKLNFKYKIFIAGNHDWGFQRFPEEIKNILKNYPGIIYLQDESIIIEDIKIHGSPWQPEFYSWAFNLKRGKELQDKWDMIDPDTSIVITHGPVHGLLDMSPDGRFVGCENLLDTIVTKLNNVILHVCGHIHCARGYAYKYGKTFVNACVLNEQYNVVHKPILVKFDKEEKEATVIEY